MPNESKKFKFTPARYYKCDQPITFIIVQSESSVMHRDFIDCLHKFTCIKVISKDEIDTCEVGYMYVVDEFLSDIADLCKVRNMCIRRCANCLVLIQLMDPKFSTEMSPFVTGLFNKYIVYEPHINGLLVNFVLKLMSLIM